MTSSGDANASISVERLKVAYGARVVVDDVSFDVASGRITVLIGPNGAGKSTVLKSVAGLLPYGGSVRYGVDDARAMASEQRARRVAYVPQRSELMASLSVREIVSQGRFAHRGETTEMRSRIAVDEALAEVGIVDIAGRAYPRLSGGEQRLVLLARALATEAPIILLDEPAASLDVAHVLRLFRLLRRLADSGRAILCVLHALDDARNYGDRVLLLQEGRLVAKGPAAEVVTTRCVRSVYDVELLENQALGFRLMERGPGDRERPVRR